jgi:hypothetical protein
MKIILKAIILLYFLILITNINSKIVKITNILQSSNLDYINDNYNNIVKHLNINTKSISNKEYNITLAISSFKLLIKVDILEVPIISFQNIYTLERLYQVSKYFRIFDTIEEVYEDLIILFENDIEIVNHNTYLELIAYIQNSKINNITFILPNIQRDIDQKIDELFSIIKDLKNENIMLKNKVDKCFEEISETQKSKKFNVLLISDQTNSLLYNLLKTCPYINEISVFNNDFIVQRFNDRIMEKFKIIIFDFKDAPFGIKFGDENIKRYLNKGGNIIFTHEQWMNDYYYQTYYYTSKIKIVDDKHPVFSSYYKLNTNNFQITETHNAFKIIFENEYLKDVIIELNNDISSEYLMIKNYVKGKLIFWNVGHKPTLTNDEEKLLVNIIAYIYQDEKN